MNYGGFIIHKVFKINDIPTYSVFSVGIVGFSQFV